ncbi:MAG: DUF6273 domain-containing protein [Eubacterium sp.]|nr:DUF6273 domain-containing protein [Eubacterium sp.]
MRKIFRNVISLGVSVVLMGSLATFGNNVVVKAEEPEVSNPRIENGISTWDCVYFGNYYINNSTEKEPILWRVLSVTDDDMYLLANRVLDCGYFNSTDGDTTWETSSLRNWLNTDFYDAAFNAEEKDAIKNTLVKSNPHAMTQVVYGNDTTDKIYLMDTQDCVNAAYGFSDNLMNMDLNRMGKVTPYVIEKGGYAVTNLGEDFEMNTYYWLRSGAMDPSDKNKAAFLTPAGGGGDAPVIATNFGIRPVLHLDKTKTDVWSYAGTIDTSSNFDEWVKPAEGIEINGYLLNNEAGGMRTVYTVTDTIDGKEVVDRGLIYGVGGYAQQTDMYIGSTSEYVASYSANEYGPASKNYSQVLTTGTSYLMTLKFATASAKELTTDWYVRAYAKLSDDTYVYSDVVTYKIFNVMDYLYKNKKMKNEEEHNALYENYLKKVDSNYEVIPFQ